MKNRRNRSTTELPTGRQQLIVCLLTPAQGNVLFNDALNTFYLQLYGIIHMVKDHSDSEKGNPLLPHRLLFPIISKGSFICTIPDRIARTTAFVTPVVEHWLEREIAQWVTWTKFQSKHSYTKKCKLFFLKTHTHTDTCMVHPAHSQLSHWLIFIKNFLLILKHTHTHTHTQVRFTLPIVKLTID